VDEGNAESAESVADRARRLEDAWVYRPSLLALARRHAPRGTDPEDVVSEAYLRLATADLRDEAAVCDWLRTTVRNLCRDAKRRAPSQVKLARLHAVWLDVVADLADGVCDRAEAGWLARKIEQLPKPNRIVGEVLLAGGWVAEVGERLAVSDKAAAHRIARTCARLRLVVMADRAAAVVAVVRLRRLRRPVIAGAAPVLVLTVIAALPHLLPPSQPISTPVQAEPAAPPRRSPAPVRTPVVPSWSPPPVSELPVVPPVPLATRSVDASVSTVGDTWGRSPAPEGNGSPLSDVLSCVQHVEVTPQHVGCPPT
jgi:DNA-directed RNA polymerase specialized sigma24 family protein